MIDKLIDSLLLQLAALGFDYVGSSSSQENETVTDIDEFYSNVRQLCFICTYCYPVGKQTDV